MAEIKTEGGSLYVYTHWGGYSLPADAAEAIKMARGRWQDECYAVRIIVDQLTKGGRDKETGFGLMLRPDAEDEYNGDKPSVVIDLTQRRMLAYRDGKTYTKDFQSILIDYADSDDYFINWFCWPIDTAQ